MPKVSISGCRGTLAYLGLPHDRNQRHAQARGEVRVARCSSRWRPLRGARWVKQSVPASDRCIRIATILHTSRPALLLASCRAAPVVSHGPCVARLTGRVRPRQLRDQHRGSDVHEIPAEQDARTRQRDACATTKEVYTLVTSRRPTSPAPAPADPARRRRDSASGGRISTVMGEAERARLAKNVRHPAVRSRRPAVES